MSENLVRFLWRQTAKILRQNLHVVERGSVGMGDNNMLRFIIIDLGWVGKL